MPNYAIPTNAIACNHEIPYSFRVLLERTIKLLKSDRRSLPQIAKEAGLSYSWLTKISCGAITDPRVTQLEELYNFLKKSRRK